MIKTLTRMALSATTCLALNAGIAAASPYDDYKGQTLVVNFPAHPHYDAVMKILPEFNQSHGYRSRGRPIALPKNARTTNSGTGER